MRKIVWRGTRKISESRNLICRHMQISARMAAQSSVAPPAATEPRVARHLFHRFVEMQSKVACTITCSFCLRLSFTRFTPLHSTHSHYVVNITARLTRTSSATSNDHAIRKSEIQEKLVVVGCERCEQSLESRQGGHLYEQHDFVPTEPLKFESSQQLSSIPRPLRCRHRRRRDTRGRPAFAISRTRRRGRDYRLPHVLPMYKAFKMGEVTTCAMDTAASESHDASICQVSGCQPQDGEFDIVSAATALLDQDTCTSQREAAYCADK